jgi:hypothetical protein
MRTYLSSDVPGPVAGEPVVTDCGRNWLTLSWPKSEIRGGAPVLAYRVEAWPLGGDGGARWIEVCAKMCAGAQDNTEAGIAGLAADSVLKIQMLWVIVHWFHFVKFFQLKYWMNYRCRSY